ncbi:hypothetical protein WJX73_001695 [Symbiochloris irregularis]|uniref:MD-2-related lipid-recognition domain-containing protein n=1 Tax=Symbiochloris irregularis TaxID=706552 RepID=A0AAW1PHB8_9CHLO
MLAFVVLTAASSFAAVHAANFTYCSEIGSVSISTITLDPEELVVGQSVQVNVTGETKVAAENPVIAVDVTHEGVSYLNNVQVELCYLPDNYSESGDQIIECPIGAGRFQYSFPSPVVPTIVPSGKYGLTLNLADGGGPLVCVRLNVTVVSGAQTSLR